MAWYITPPIRDVRDASLVILHLLYGYEAPGLYDGLRLGPILI